MLFIRPTISISRTCHIDVVGHNGAAVIGATVKRWRNLFWYVPDASEAVFSNHMLTNLFGMDAETYLFFNRQRISTFFLFYHEVIDEDLHNGEFLLHLIAYVSENLKDMDIK